MRITNLRRGRIFRTAGICVVLIILIYALHSYSSSNAVESINTVLSNDAPTYYKFHRDVYPTIKTGEFSEFLDFLSYQFEP